MKLLHLDSSLFDDQSVSRTLTAQIVERLREGHSPVETTYRDLAASPPSHLSASILGGAGLSAEERSAAQSAEVELTETLLAEFLGADVVVVGAPMYNFAIPSQLKAWFDRILQAGKTFRYTADGPEGLAGGRQVIVASSRGGVYSQGAAAAMDFQESYLRAVFGMIGIDDVTIIRAEGVAMGEDYRRSALADARRAICEGVAVVEAA